MTRKTLVLTGGGVLGVTYSGAFRAMEEQGIEFREFESIYGTSVGGLVGLLVVLQMPNVSIQKLLMSIPISSFFQFSANGILTMPDTGGIDSGSGLRRLIRSVLRRITGHTSLTLGELYQRYPTKFTVNALDIRSGKHILLGTHETPDIKVEDALCATSAIPGLYVPVTVNNMVLVDGGVWDSLLIQHVPLEDIPTTIALAPAIQQDPPSEKPDLLFILRASFNALTMRGITQYCQDERYKKAIIRISTPINSTSMFSKQADSFSTRETLDFIGYTEVSRSEVITEYLKLINNTIDSSNTDIKSPGFVDQLKTEDSQQHPLRNELSGSSDMTSRPIPDTSSGSSHSLPPPVDTRELGGSKVTPLTYQPTV
jgi:predicted acylesterase/phospholipase RssA